MKKIFTAISVFVFLLNSTKTEAQCPPAPVKTGTPPLQVCQNTGVSVYSVQYFEGQGTYEWKYPVGSATLVAGGTPWAEIELTWTTPGVHALKVRRIRNGCPGDFTTFYVDVESTPGQPSVPSGSAMVCAGETQSYDVSALWATSYAVTLPGSATVTGTDAGGFGVNWTGGVSGNMVVRGQNLCATGTLSSSLYVHVGPPLQPGAINGYAVACPGKTGVSYSISPVSQATGYTWSVPGGAVIVSGQGTSNITVNWGNTSGDISVVAYNRCGSSPSRALPVTFINPSFTAGPAEVCTSTNNKYATQTSDIVPHMYEWTISPGGTFTDATTLSKLSMVNVNWHTPGDQWVGINYSHNNGCRATSPTILHVKVHPFAVPYNVSGGGTFCDAGFSASVNLSGSQTGINYQLQVDGADVGTALSGTGGPLTWNNLTREGIYSVVAKNPACSQTMNGNATVSHVIQGAIISGVRSISEAPGMLSVAVVPGYTYQWKYEGENIPGETSGTLTVSKPGNYQVLVSDGSCSKLSPSHYVSKQGKRYYNGIISSLQWRTDKPNAVEEENFKGMYIFDYDEKYQLRGSQWAQPDFATNEFTPDNRYRIANLTYDANGNILTMQRYDSNGMKKHDFSYRYEYMQDTPKYNNRLKSVSGYVDAYTYNTIGQMTGEDKADTSSGDSTQAADKDQYVEYDVSGKVRKVFSDAGKTQLKVEFIYDDRGFRLAKKNYESAKKTWYIRDAGGSVLGIYEESLADTSHESFEQREVPIYGAGKLGTIYPQEQYAAAYELTDHLGNVRAIVKDNVEEFIATLEDNGQADYGNPRVHEMAVFQNLFETEQQDYRFNHTPGGEYSSYLYWRESMQDSANSVGPATALRVSAGDTVRLEAFARFEEKGSYSRDVPLALLAQFLGNTFALQGAFEGFNATQVASSFSAGLGLAGFGNDGTDETTPFAYINYILFDSNTGFVDAGWERVGGDAGFRSGQELPVMHGKVTFSEPVIVPENGYIYVWLSNQSEDTKVWFDDLKITISSAYVAQATDYGIWGDVLREQKSEPNDRYRWYYQGQYAEHDEETGWNHFELREYDPVIGRWLVPDPEYQFWSPYVGMGNNPVAGIDMQGSRVFFFIKSHAERALLNINRIFKSQFKIENAVTIKERVVAGTNKKGFYLEFNSNVDLSKLDDKSRFVVQSFKDLLNANTDILGEIVDPNTKASRLVTVGEAKGYTFGPTHFAVPNNLPDFDSNKFPQFNIGSQILHELLWHISPAGRELHKIDFTSSWLYSILRAPFGNSHPPGDKQNNAVPVRKPFTHYID